MQRKGQVKEGLKKTHSLSNKKMLSLARHQLFDKHPRHLGLIVYYFGSFAFSLTNLTGFFNRCKKFDCRLSKIVFRIHFIFCCKPHILHCVQDDTQPGSQNKYHHYN